MKSLLSVLLALLCSSPLFAAGAAPVPSPDQLQAVDGSNAFAIDLYDRLRTRPGNLFFSPESISTAFAMTYAGARGETAAQMATVFHYTLPPDRLHPAMGALLTAMNASHNGYELRVADALWAQENIGFLSDYLKLTQADYAAGLHQLNFKTAPEAARSTINEWVEKQTNDKIKDLLPGGTITPSTRLVLTNAIYFKGDWMDQFEKSSTQEGDFHLAASQTAKAQLMHRRGSYRYFDGGSFQELELPYKTGELSMIVLLPTGIDGLPALERSLTAALLHRSIEGLQPVHEVILTFPRFTMTQQFELNNALTAMGMGQAFSGAANFSGMTGKPDFLISAAVHKAFIDVTETGTEAAAATSIVMQATAMRMQMPEPPPLVFRADHPFLFLIRDTRTGAILFMGRVEDPTK